MMRRKGGRESEVRDVEILLDELYATAPPHFVSRRAELAARARTDGRTEDARRIRAARRPTLAAWAANLLWHSQPTESRRFLELGRGLREAYRTLDAAEIKELSDQRTSVVAAMSRQAATLAREAGHRLSDAAQQDVVSTLRAVLADESAADLWATGRLEGALTPPTAFPSGEDAAPAPAPVSSAPAPKAPKDELAERRRQKREQRAEKAREAADAAHQRLQERRTEQQEADASLQRARARYDLARQQVADAEQELSGAREDLRRAERERQAAEERGGAATDAVTAAERAAQEAAETARKLLDELD